MSHWKKGLAAFVVIGAFVLVTAMLTDLVLDRLQDSWQAVPQRVAAFPRAITEPAETEPTETEAPVETEPAPTLPPETIPVERSPKSYTRKFLCFI